MFFRTSQSPCSAATVRGPFLNTNSPVSLQTYVPTRFFESKVSSQVTTIIYCCLSYYLSYSCIASLTRDSLPQAYGPDIAKWPLGRLSISCMIAPTFSDRYSVRTIPSTTTVSKTGWSTIIASAVDSNFAVNASSADCFLIFSSYLFIISDCTSSFLCARASAVSLSCLCGQTKD